MYVLGIETSCDETSASIVNMNKEILSNVVFSQVILHDKYGGVVPEIASRSHLEVIKFVINQALTEAKIKLTDVKLIGVTSGPGLVGSLIVGIMVAKSIGYSLNIEVIEINHLEGHILAARLCNEIKFPFLAMLASGGHCQLLIANNVNNYQKLGGTIDDAAGEAFDKIAKMLNLPYPGGPIIEEYAKEGNEKKFNFPIVFKNRPNCDFSFSGLKTSVKNLINELIAKNQLDQQAIKDIAASFQYVVSEIFCDRIGNAIKLFTNEKNLAEKKIILVGGVAANNYIRTKISKMLAEKDFELITPPSKLCTDNAAMIGWAAIEKFKLGLKNNINFEPKARWNLENLCFKGNYEC